VENSADQKMKKDKGAPQLKLSATPDILAEISKDTKKRRAS